MTEREQNKMSSWRRCLWFLAGSIFNFWFKNKIGVEIEDKDLRKVVGLYGTGKQDDVFSKIRVWDAPYELVESLVPKKGVIVDVGCGDGLFANYLGLSGRERRVLGVDVNRERLKKAEKGIKNVKFEWGDVLKKKISRSDTIVLIHLLHHLSSREQQDNFLLKCSESLNKRGKIVVVEIGERPLLKYVLTFFVDMLVYPLLIEGKILGKFCYRSTNEWEKALERVGVSVKVVEAHRGKPFSHVIIWGEKQ